MTSISRDVYGYVSRRLSSLVTKKKTHSVYVRVLENSAHCIRVKKGNNFKSLAVELFVGSREIIQSCTAAKRTKHFSRYDSRSTFIAQTLEHSTCLEMKQKWDEERTDTDIRQHLTKSSLRVLNLIEVCLVIMSLAQHAPNQSWMFLSLC